MSRSFLNIQVLLLVSITFSLIILTNNFQLTNAPCSSTLKQQSPININTQNTKYYEEKTFRIISSNHTSSELYWQNFEEQKSIGFVLPTNDENQINGIVLVKDWSMYNYNLTHVLFRYGSGHTIDTEKYDLEMEFHYEINESYRTKGRYIHHSSNKLIISKFFIVSSNLSETSQFFNGTNLEEFSKSPRSTLAFEKEIKLSHLIQNLPGYLYEGSETFGDCETALRIIYPKFQLMSDIDYEYFRQAYTTLNYINNAEVNTNNNRNQQPVNPNTVVYRNSASFSDLIIEANSIQYIVSSFISVNIIKVVGLLVLCFLN